jgi:perosamine synthetase
MLADRLGPLLARPPRLSFGAGRPEGHAAWAARLRGVVRRLIAATGDASSPPRSPAPAPPERLPATAPWQAELTGSGRRGGLWYEDYRLTAPGHPGTRATLLRPAPGAAAAGAPSAGGAAAAAPDRHPAVLVCPGRNARLGQLTGAEPPDHPDRNLAERLARRGMATFTVDYGLLGGLDPRLAGGRDEVNLLAQALALTGRSPLALLVEDALRSLAWLAAQPWLDGGRIAVAGHSLGGIVALHAALIAGAAGAAGQPLPVVLASTMGSYPAMFGRRLTAGGAHALPGILRWADLCDLAAALAPTPLQIQHGEHDAILPLAEARTAMEVVARAYDAAGAGHCLDLFVAPMGHGTDGERAAAFLAASFAGAGTGTAPCQGGDAAARIVQPGAEAEARLALAVP